MRLEETRGNLTRVAVSRYAPRVSHLLFADDTLIFCQATKEAIRCVKNILSLLKAASGLKVSAEKSSIVFSKNTPAAVKESLANLMGMRLEERHNKYLGLPTTVGRSKREVFIHVKEQIWAKLQDWQTKNVSQAGKFWRIARNPDCLLSKLLKIKYFPKTDVFEVQVNPLSSATWRGILETRPVVVGDQVGSDAMIAELLEDEGNGRKVELVSFIFIKEDVDCILSIPLPADKEEMC
ncbi:UNVERIFIED_CONTAM: hypothetical protein Sradi_3414900 [Sesamum radiatum]|uniref:Reverse transcriptase domain-containing protein n=1 Tax=Sesamum radiatum TaxID=300843 RepID=A0AAW2R4D4_SESRA